MTIEHLHQLATKISGTNSVNNGSKANPRLIPSGTKPDGRRVEPRHGRYTVLQASDRKYLYVPEIQEVFSVSNDVANLLRVAEVNPILVAETQGMSVESQAAYQFVAMLIEENHSEPLSEIRSQHKGLRDVVIHVSQRCNLGCVYCYAAELNKINDVMKIDTADRVITQAMRLAPDGLASVKFLGGEPTLAWSVIDHLMDGFEAASIAANLPPPHYTMVTNGTRMTSKMIDSAARHGMHILVSIDGPQEIHDSLRPYLGGAGSYKKATGTLKALMNAGVDVAVESVYTRQHFLTGITPQAMIDHFISLGIRVCHIPPAIGEWHGANTFAEMADVTHLYVEAVRNSVRSYRTSSPYLLRGIQFVLDGFAIRERRRHVCGAGRTFMGINYDGEAFPCYLLQSPEVSYGFVADNWDDDRYENIRSQFACNGKEHHPVCRECWANEICQSCLGTSWHLEPGIAKPPAWFCAFQKTLIGAVIAEIASARESDSWDVFTNNWKRHLAPLVAPETLPHAT